jgi:hypothetical protein
MMRVGGVQGGYLDMKQCGIHENTTINGLLVSLIDLQAPKITFI